MGFRLAVQLSGNWRSGPSREGFVALAHKTLSNPHDLPLAQTDFLRDFLVGEASFHMAFVGQQKILARRCLAAPTDCRRQIASSVSLAPNSERP